MKLLRVGPAGAERPAALLPDGTAVDISSLVHDRDDEVLPPAGLRKLSEQLRVAARSLPVVDLATERVGSPVRRVGKIVCVGLNYREHAAEAGLPVPAEPVLFLKAPYTVVGPNDEVLIPPASGKTDYEVELAVIVGTTARYLGDGDDPLDYVCGYSVSNDVSEREFQLERGGQWDKGKNCETFSPLGPLLVTKEEVPDPQALRMWLTVNGELRQNSTTADMIFDVAQIVRYVSQFMVLLAGDVINTGTPAGVGAGFQPPRFLDDGDVVELGIDGLGKQRLTFRRFERTARP